MVKNINDKKILLIFFGSPEGNNNPGAVQGVIGLFVKTVYLAHRKREYRGVKPPDKSTKLYFPRPINSANC
jgi:hypothetical protein